MIRVVDSRLVQESLTGSWLSSRLGVGTHRLDAMRRAGELLGVRRPGGYDYLYPGWQFSADGRPLPGVQRVIAAARGRGISDDRLYEILSARAGIGGGERLSEALRQGRDDYVVSVVSTTT
jgi:hypothetical protein